MWEMLTNLAIGWAAKKVLDLLWSGAARLAAWTKSKLSLTEAIKKNLAAPKHAASFSGTFLTPV
ncbi:MAG TPA: hypothetical protein VK146_09710 [Tabrizicola sp.]|nr:hypothetical protein [Tabrizicola sp.]